MYVIHAHICDNTEETHLLSNTFQLGIMLEVLFNEQGQAKEAGMRSLINVTGHGGGKGKRKMSDERSLSRNHIG